MEARRKIEEGRKSGLAALLPACGDAGLNQRPDRVVVPREIEEMARVCVDAAFCIHRELGPGLLESAYETCFVRELEIRGLVCRTQVPIPLHYKGREIEAGFRADVIVGQKLLVELKAVEQLLPIHRAQIITYLKLMKFPLGLMINFNETWIKDGIKRVLNVPRT